VIVGDSEFIGKAKLFRKALGGGMRQTGMIAAPALIAVKNWK
jgi:threonine aldolase